MRALAILLLSTVAFAETYKVENNILVVPQGGDAAIDYVKGYLAEKSYVSTMRIEVHVDTDGDAKKTQKLTEQRALAVAKALVAKGVDCKRLVPVGFGGTKPIAANDTPANKALNRRTTFAIAALRGHAIGGMPLDGGGVVAGDPCK
jgi:OmpA-OmpF porin, OOP family